MELSHIIYQARFPLKQVNGKFHTESKENLYTYLKSMFRCNYGERQWDIGYTGIQNRHVASIEKVTVPHHCIGMLQNEAKKGTLACFPQYLAFLQAALIRGSQRYYTHFRMHVRGSVFGIIPIMYPYTVSVCLLTW